MWLYCCFFAPMFFFSLFAYACCFFLQELFYFCYYVTCFFRFCLRLCLCCFEVILHIVVFFCFVLFLLSVFCLLLDPSKPGLFGYRHHPTINDMISDGNARTEKLTDFARFQCVSLSARTDFPITLNETKL